jgi:hypothetical protein
MNDTIWGDNQGSMSVEVIPAAVANEGPGGVTQIGTYSDPDGGQNVAITASVGSVLKTGVNTGTWTWSNTAPDGPASYDVIITANDGDGGIATTKFRVYVNNVAPSLTVNVGATNTAYYVDWTSANVAGGTASGVITLPDASTINVSLSTSGGGFFGAQTSGLVPPTINYWNPAAPFISAQVPNAPPDSDIIQLQGGTGTVYTVTLSQPIVDPIMAIVSLGQFGNTITYNFDSPFTIVSQGVGFWGGCSTCLVQLPNNVLQGTEGHGTIKFLGTFSTFSWTVPTPETWHGFTFAIRTTGALGNINVNEGQTATNSGTWSDPGVNDNVALSASAGIPIKTNGTWTWSFATSDGPDQSQTISITATDKDGASTTKTFPLVVNNVAPTVALTGPNSANEGETKGYTFTVTDPGQDTFVPKAGYPRCGGIDTEMLALTLTSTGGSFQCKFKDGPATRTVEVQVTDSDGADSNVASQAVTVSNVAPTATFNAPPGWVGGTTPVVLSLTSPLDPSPVDTAAGFQYAFDCGAGYGALGVSSSVTCTSMPDGIHVVKGKIRDKDGGQNEYTATVKVDRTPPTCTCSPTVNPSGKNVPQAGNNPKSGQNPDGFYVTGFSDSLSGVVGGATISDTGSAFTAGPYASGTDFKLTQAPGVTPNVKPGAGAIDWHIQLKGDAQVTVTDAAGNSTTVDCKVAPPPK